MSDFETDFVVEHLGGRWWRLKKPLIYRSDYLGSRIRVPVGFVTDFASVPRLPVVYWLLGSKADEPATVHDYLYRFPSICSRFEADHVYVESMYSKKYSCINSEAHFVGVRSGGWWSYGANAGVLDPR